MGRYVNVDYNRLYYAAKQILSKADALERVDMRAKSALQQVSYIWQGYSQIAYSTCEDRWRAYLGNMKNSLRSLARSLNSIADYYEREDKRLEAEARRRAEEARRRRAAQSLK
ncbi:WXG100 family type VII secretion target [Anaerobacterium chartisolvens]|uniref:WXG100 family type VII secretion target n=1 Tax=Anaerobacterium chartisolvens TaxID=1297424 RepID=A0A369AXR7_9FIRM|nr:WXG100 family type VII secretion target [Anaerobacterium chartisolvens]RCX13016.1 WXG100 family type VII secretion target [Anaerobacterium chartisolvens]